MCNYSDNGEKLAGHGGDECRLKLLMRISEQRIDFQ